MGAHTTAVPESIANAINQLSANQTALMTQISQIAAMSLAQRPQAPSFQTMHTPPIQQIAIQAIQPFSGAATATGFQTGTSAGGGRDGRNRHNGRGGRGAGRGGGQNDRTPFATYQQGQGRGACGFLPQGPPGFIPQAPPRGNNKPATPPLNFVKRFTNNNVCYLCGSDVKGDHTSVTCPGERQKMSHQEAFTRENAQGYIAVGWDACTKGKHKNLFPGF